MNIIPLPYRLLALAALLAVFGLWCWTKGADHADGEWQVRMAKQERMYDERHQKLARDIHTADVKHHTELEKKREENDRLRAAVAAGTVRLRLAASCPSQAPAGSPGVDHGGEPVLDRAAEQAYFALRDGIARKEQQLKACQEILRKERE